MTRYLPIFLIVALAGCTEGAGLFSSAPATAPGTGAGAEAGAGEAPEGAPETDDAAAADASAAPAPQEQASSEPVRTEGDPFDAPRAGTSEPAREVASVEAPTPAPAPAGDGRLGTTTASLGDPNEPGFWVKTPLVSSPQSGRVVYVSSGRSVQVQLIPAGSAGGGSQISVAAMRLLEAPLTGLPELVVYAN